MAGTKKSKSGQAKKSNAGRTALKDLRVSEKGGKKVSGGAPTAVERSASKGDLRAVSGGMLSLGGKSSQ